MTSDQSKLRLTLQSSSEATIVRALEQALSPTVLNESMLELIIGLPEFQKNPTLIRPLLPFLDRLKPRIGSATMIVAARLAHQSGCREFAARTFIRYVPAWVRRQAACCLNCLSDTVPTLQMLIEYHPSLVLRLIRSTRPRSIDSDRDEVDYDRRKLLANCFDALGRSRLAAEMRKHK